MEQSFLLYMVLLLFVAKLLEKIFGYIRINPVVAYIIAGLVLGPAGLGIVNPLKSLEALSYLGLMLLIFYTGLTTSFNELKNASLRILVIGTSGILTTITICFLVLNSMGFDFVKSVIISVILSNTATEVAATTISRIHSDFVRSVVIGASIVDDIIAVILLSTVSSSYIGVGDSYSVLYVVLLSIVFLVSVIILSNFLVNKPGLFYQKLALNRASFASISILLASLFAFISKVAGLNELIGIYLAGLLINRGRESHDPLLITSTALAEFVDQLKIFLESFALPLFFTYVGLIATPTNIDFPLYLNLLTIAILGKVIGCGVPSYIFTRNKYNSIAIGLAMVGRGALETALLKILLDLNMINTIEYTTILFTALTTTILTPLIFSLAIEHKLKR